MLLAQQEAILVQVSCWILYILKWNKYATERQVRALAPTKYYTQ